LKKVIFGLLMMTAACTQPLGMSVPMQSGHNLHSARVAVDSCAAEADIGGNAAVVGGYMTSILLTGVVIGTIITIPAQDGLRSQGEIDQVDRCMTERGFKRRKLDDGEIVWIRTAYGPERERRLDHLVGGGSIETYPKTAAKS